MKKAEQDSWYQVKQSQTICLFIVNDEIFLLFYLFIFHAYNQCSENYSLHIWNNQPPLQGLTIGQSQKNPL